MSTKLLPIGAIGLELIKVSEGLRLTSYLCPAGKWTIGYGHTGPEVKRGQRITVARALELLHSDADEHRRSALKLVRVALTQNQQDAITSFVFNLGVGNFAASTLLRKLNTGDYAGAAREFLKWDKATVDDKKVALPGLTLRRKRECILFTTPYDPAQEATQGLPKWLG